MKHCIVNHLVEATCAAYTPTGTAYPSLTIEPVVAGHPCEPAGSALLYRTTAPVAEPRFPGTTVGETFLSVATN